MPDSVKCYIRILHAIPDAPGVDLYINDHLAVQDLKYRDFTQYYGGSPGIYNLKVYSRAHPAVLIIDKNIELSDKIIYTLALCGELNDPGIFLTADRKKETDKSRAHIRYINVLPSVTDLDITMNGNTVIGGLTYGEASDYLTVDPGTYSVKALDSRTGNIKLEDPRMTLYAGKEYAGYFVGISEVQILIPLEGATYLTF